MAVCCGAGVAFFMGLQRYSLEYPVFQVVVPPCGCKMKRPHAWILGLVSYVVCNLTYSCILTTAPLSLLSSLFTLLLVWNIAFANMWGEKLTPPKVYGALVILLWVSESQRPAHRVARQLNLR